MNSLNRYSNQYKQDIQRAEQKKYKTIIKQLNKNKTMKEFSLFSINQIALTLQGNKSPENMDTPFIGILNKECEVLRKDRIAVKLVLDAITPFFPSITECFKIEDLAERQKALLETKVSVSLPNITEDTFNGFPTTPFEDAWVSILLNGEPNIPAVQPSVEVIEETKAEETAPEPSVEVVE
jgi:hypothetical protein